MNSKILLSLFFSYFIISCTEKVKSTETKVTTNVSGKDLKSEPKKKSSIKDTITIEYLYKDQPYDYETKLSNGYNLEFSYFRSKPENSIEMCLTMRNRNKIIDTLNNESAGLPHKNLGYIGADFNEYFAFVNSFGSGNPHEFKLIRKADAKTMISGFIIDDFKKPEILLYAKGYDSLMIYDIEKNKNNYIENISNSKDIDGMISQLNQMLNIKKVTNQYVYIEIENREGEKIIKKYYR